MTSRIAHKIEAKSRTGDVVINENVDFTGLLLSEKVLDGLKNGGFVRPSPIQLKAIPLGRCGLDLIVQAKSGTGKTCVFTVIALEGLQCESTATQVLVLAPTREIAVQIYDVVETIGSAIPALEVATFIGGMPLQEDKQKLKKCHVAVGTPGRIKQLIERKLLNTDNIRLFVLDEADKLLEESFQEQINWIYSTLPNNKQILALSATYPTYLDEHLTKYMRNPTFIRLNVSDPALLGIKQYYVEVPFSPSPVQLFEQKASVVSNLLSSVSFHQCLIFSNLQTMAQNLSDLLNNEGWPTTCIAGCLEQTDRLEAMEKLKSYKCRVLISTDLTARGIDAERVNIVINLDVPRDHETYLHRIGRAGRFGSFGAAVTVVSKGQEESDLKSVERKCKTSIKCLPDPVPSDLLKSDPVLLSEFVSTEQIVTRTEDESIGIHSSEFSLGKSEHCGMDDGDIVNRYNPVTHEMSELALTDNTNSHDLPKCNGVNHYDSSNESEKSLSDNRKDVPMSIAGDSEGKDSENQASIEKFQINTDTFHEQQFNDQNNFETYACHTGCNEAGEQLKKVESVSIEASGCKYKVEHLSSSDMETSSSSHVSEKDTIVNENLHGSPALKNISTSEVSETSQSRNSSSSQKKIDSPIRTPRKKKQNHPRSLSYWLNQLNENNQTQNTMSESNFSNLPSSDVGKDQMSSDNVSRGSVSLLPIVSQMESIPDLVSAPVDIERYSKTLPNVNSIGNISNNAVNAVSFQKNSNTEESSNISTHKMFDHASDEKECVIKDQNTIATISPDSCDGKIQSPKEPVSIIAPDPSVNKKSASLKSEKCESNECISYENFSHSSSASIAQPFDVSCQRIVSHYNPEPHMNLNNSPEKTDLQSYLTTDCSEVSKNNDSQNTKEKESAEKSNRSALAYNDLDIFDSNFTEVETPKNKKYNRKNKNPGKRKSAKKPVNPEQTYDDMLKEYAQKRNSELQEIDNIQNKNTSPSRGSDTSGRKIIKANRSNVKSEVKTEQAIDENYNGSTLTVEKKICTSLEHDTSSSYSVDNYLCPLSAHVSLGVNTLSRIDTYSDVCKDFEQYLSNNSQSQQKMFKEPDLTNIICPQQSDNNSYNKTVRLQIKQIIDSAYDEYFNTSKCTQKSQKTDDNSCKFISTENSEQPNICTETSDIEFTKNYSSSATSPSLKRETLELTASEFHTEITGKSVVVTKPGFVSESEKTTRTQVYTAVPGFQRDLCATQTSTCPSTDKCEHYIIKDTVKKNSMKNSTCIDMGTNTDDHLFLSWVKKYKIQNVPLERVKLNMDGKEINIMEPLTIDTNLCSGSDDSLCSITPDAVEYDEFIYTDGEKQKYTKFPKNSDGMKYTAKPKSLSKNTEKIKNSSQRASKVTNEFQNGNSKMKEKKNINHSNATKQPPDKTCDKMHSRSSSRNKAKDNYKEAWNAESAVFHDFPFYPHSQSFPDYANNYYTTNTKSQQSLEQWEKKASRQHRQTHHSVSNHWSDWWERYKEFYMQYYDYYQMVTGWSNNHLDFVENSQQTYNMQWKYQNMMKN